MDNEPLVSAIITTHNRLDLLKRAIDSVLSQTFQNIECIVVSDNSTDGTNEYCSTLKDITFIEIPASESRGANHARNIGIDAASGKYLAFLDDDDYWLPRKITMQVSLIEKEHYGLVSCGRYIETVEKGSSKIEEAEISGMPSPDMSKRSLYSFITLSSLVLIQKDIAVLAGKFDEGLSVWQDYEFFLRLAQITTFGSVPSRLVVYREDVIDKNKASNKFKKWKESVKYIYEKHNNLYSTLTFREKLEVKHLYYGDGYGRAKKNNLKCTAFIFKRNFMFFRRTSKILSLLGIR